jgi:hypothetical protein
MRNRFVAMMCAGILGLMALSAPALSQPKTAKACQDEWRANKEMAAAAGAGAGLAAGAEAGAAGAAAVPPAVTPAAAPAGKPAPTAASAPTGANEFAAEAQAKAHCPSDTVVWANLDSKVYHFSGNKNFGTTKEGAYMCEKDALGQGVRAAKNEKHP